MIVRRRLFRLLFVALSAELARCLHTPVSRRAVAQAHRNSSNSSDPVPESNQTQSAKASSVGILPNVKPGTTWYADVPQVKHAKERGSGYRKGSPLYEKQQCARDGNCERMTTTLHPTTPHLASGEKGTTPPEQNSQDEKESTPRYVYRRVFRYIMPGSTAKETSAQAERYFPAKQYFPRKYFPKQYFPEDQTQEYSLVKLGSSNFMILLFAVLYYFLIVRKYPKLPDGDWVSAPVAAREYKSLNEINAARTASCPVCFHALCCFAPRAAHTFHSAGIMEYWCGCILMQCFPCCTLFCMNQFTTLNERLGGTKRNLCLGALCTFCCSCCVVTQDAQTLDMITGATTGLCGVKEPQELMEQQPFGRREV